MDTRAEPHRRLKTQSKTQYLLAYNGISAALWFTILARTLLLIPLVGFENVYGGVGLWTKWTQTLALAEVVHSASGIVRAPLLTTAMQVLSRLLLVWPVCTYHPTTTQTSLFYSTMLLAWSVTEVIRYSYFVLNLQGGGVPGWLSWLRYNTFYVLYPVGIGSEAALLWKASMQEETGEYWRVGFWAVLGVYVPGSYVLYSHMIKQRRKMMRGKGKERM